MNYIYGSTECLHKIYRHLLNSMVNKAVTFWSYAHPTIRPQHE